MGRLCVKAGSSAQFMQPDKTVLKSSLIKVKMVSFGATIYSFLAKVAFGIIVVDKD